MRKLIVFLSNKFTEANLTVQFIVSSVVMLLVLGPYYIISERNEIEAFKEKRISIGIVESVTHSHSSRHRTHRIYFTYKADKMEELSAFDDQCDHSCVVYRQKGDTIVIEYSTSNKAYARIVSCYWNDNVKKEYGFYKW